ncbi:MAG TPA: RidA family protein, partial [Vicinamibacterales bacterium]
MTPNSPTHPFAPSARLGRFIVLSGALPTGADGQVVAGDVGTQTRQVLTNLQQAAAQAGTTLDRAVKVHVFLRRASDFAAMNEVYRTFFTDQPPARTTVVAGLRNPDALVEITAVLAAPGEPREVVHPPSWKRSPNPYSYAIRSGDTVFLAGLVSRRGADNSMVPGDVAAQTDVIFENARELLGAAGMTLEDVVSSRVYLTSAASFAAMNDAYRRAFPQNPPARATVIAGLMNDELSVEITLVAVRDASRKVIGEAGSLPLSPGVAAGGRLYLSGMLGNTPATAGDVRAQTT